MKRIDHAEAYSMDGACTNAAEEYFSRLRRAEIGHHHHIAGDYLLRYAQEASWRGQSAPVKRRTSQPPWRVSPAVQAVRRFRRLLAAACSEWLIQLMSPP